MAKIKNTGSRFLYEPFDSTTARIDTHEKVVAERWNALEKRLTMIEAALERLEKRLWIAVYSVFAVVMVGGITALLETITL